MNRIPMPTIPLPASTYLEKTMCRSCAYRVKPTPEEDEMTIMYFMEGKNAHPCHERKNVIACVGSMASLERLTEWKRPVRAAREINKGEGL